MINKYNKTLVQIIKHLRTKKGITQEQMAFEINISTSYLGMIERGERNISLKNICSISKYFNKKPSELLEMVEQELEKQR